MRHLLTILTLLPLLVQGQQNLVPNSGFEDHLECPWLLSQISNAEPWIDVSGPGSPDYFHQCGADLILPPDTLPYVGVPENIRGWQEPHSGDGYAGIFVYNGPILSQLREYIQVQLLEPLMPGVRYRVSFYVSLANQFRYAICSFGAFFSPNQVITNNWMPLDFEPQVQSPTHIIYSNKNDWILVQDTFVTRIDEASWLIIGNFETDTSSCISLIDTISGLEDKSYYYIDDVSVVALANIPNSINEKEAFDFSVYPNPSSQVVRLESQRQLNNVRLLDILGKEVFRKDITGTANILDISGMPTGVYMIQVSDTEGRTAIKRIVKTDGP